ncbi:hypothetical protein D3C87_1592690 [compost metagenome]
MEMAKLPVPVSLHSRNGIRQLGRTSRLSKTFLTRMAMANWMPAMPDGQSFGSKLMANWSHWTVSALPRSTSPRLAAVERSQMAPPLRDQQPTAGPMARQGQPATRSWQASRKRINLIALSQLTRMALPAN